MLAILKALFLALPTLLRLVEHRVKANDKRRLKKDAQDFGKALAVGDTDRLSVLLSERLQEAEARLSGRE